MLELSSLRSQADFAIVALATTAELECWNNGMMEQWVQIL